MQLLQRVTMHGGGPKWAWLQLGLHHLDQGEPDQAVNSLRRVIRSDPNDKYVSFRSLIRDMRVCFIHSLTVAAGRF